MIQSTMYRPWMDSPTKDGSALELLDAATDGRYADIKLTDDYRLSIVDRGEEHDLSRFSGGEQLHSLALEVRVGW